MSTAEDVNNPRRYSNEDDDEWLKSFVAEFGDFVDFDTPKYADSELNGQLDAGVTNFPDNINADKEFKQQTEINIQCW